ncbi:SURF1 family protein [Methylocystis sp. 9N]|uniref:SURF1-like protein n=1 Tax=Methylocystis borbori TaxID=3118750 RepID=A0ABU7XKY3_9HYPH
MRAAARALLWPAVAAALAFALLVGLGVWQLRRLDEKEALIARIEQRASEAAQAIPPQDEWPALRPENYDFKRVRATGRFVAGRDALIFAPPPEGASREPGYLALTPFALAQGGVVLVDRGFLPGSQAADASLRAAPSGELAFEALMRAPQGRNFFTPADEPKKGVFYTRDPAAIAAALGQTAAAPFTLSLLAPLAGDGLRPIPQGAPSIVNNHLSYAITWFGLALSLLVIFALYAGGALGRSK